jgi:sugar lactone lactonase YvrE
MSSIEEAGLRFAGQRRRVFIAGSILVAIPAIVPLLAHPGSGIVVDRQRQVYFLDTGSGVWKIDRQGRLIRHEGPAFHWMAIDAEGRFGGARLPTLPNAELRHVGADPGLLLSSDFPLVIGRDGALYYPRSGNGERVQIMKWTQSGAGSVQATLPARTEHGPLRWLNGMSAGPDGSIYYTEDRAVRRIGRGGEISTVAADVTAPGCIQIPGVDAGSGVFLRGLDVAEDGTVYVAATGCGAVLKIGARGEITPVLRTASPWSPTAVAIAGREVWVLEYLHTTSDDRREWLPRVRRLAPDGAAAVVASIESR